jgi:hypothetical protein
MSGDGEIATPGAGRSQFRGGGSCDIIGSDRTDPAVPVALRSEMSVRQGLTRNNMYLFVCKVAYFAVSGDVESTKLRASICTRTIGAAGILSFC